MSAETAAATRRGRRRERRRIALRALVTGTITALAVGGVIGTLPALLSAPPAAAQDAVPTGTPTSTPTSDPTSIPTTGVTKTAADALVSEGSPFPNLSVTVSQTQDLVQQGIRISYSNGDGLASQTPGSGSGGANYLQIAQCWGEDPENPGHPDRRTCQYGGTLGIGAKRDGTVVPSRVNDQDQVHTATYRILGRPESYTAIPFVGYNADGKTDESASEEYVISAIESVNGVNRQKTGNNAVDVNTNRFFTQYTTNEIAWAPFAADGTGSVPFEIQTVAQSTGLSCGLPQTLDNGAVIGKSCWLVVIPRGSDTGTASTTQSGLWWDSWQHHIAFPLDFKPVGVRCELGQAEKQVAGSEMVSRAMQSWQPQLCTLKNGAPFVLRDANEADALVEASRTSSSALAITTRPLDLDQTAYASDPVVYAPLAFGAVTVSFSIDRNPSSTNATADQLSRARLPMTAMNLTPRLLAKLLTASYYDAIPAGPGADKSHLHLVNRATGLRTSTPAPRNLLFDPDFRAVNDPEWAVQALGDISISDVLVPNGRSDLAHQIWEYVLADYEAREWLAGKPDPWGMTVNHWYSTSDTVNPTGRGLVLPAENFPKADPTEKVDDTASPGGSGPINLVTWRPFTTGFADGAYQVLRGDGKTLGPWDGLAIPPRYTVEPKKNLGLQAVIALSTSPAASQYQTITAALQNQAGAFVEPSTAGLKAARDLMTPVEDQPAVVALDFTDEKVRTSAEAYPLTVPLYAALNPDQDGEETRASYAAFIRYAVTDGQIPGTDRGQLPPGYVPLTAAQSSQALTSATIIEEGRPVAPTPTPTASVPPPSTATTTSGGSYVSAPSSSAVTQPDAAADQGGEVTFQPSGTTPADPETPIGAAAVPLGLTAGVVAAFAVPLVSRFRPRA
ncbi:hypothetical protein [Microbacterium schleiferi]|uniref:PBP domain-containing protein n=1 Tax=Microbacterium schleiferi TaxID=69362 RepID=A0ABU7V869_9MICO